MLLPLRLFFEILIFTYDEPTHISDLAAFSVK